MNAASEVSTIWAHLEEGLIQIYEHQSKVQVPRYMGLYTCVFIYYKLIVRMRPFSLAKSSISVHDNKQTKPQQRLTFRRDEVIEGPQLQMASAAPHQRQTPILSAPISTSD